MGTPEGGFSWFSSDI